MHGPATSDNIACSEEGSYVVYIFSLDCTHREQFDVFGRARASTPHSTIRCSTISIYYSSIFPPQLSLLRSDCAPLQRYIRLICLQFASTISPDIDQQERQRGRGPCDRFELLTLRNDFIYLDIEGVMNTVASP